MICRVVASTMEGFLFVTVKRDQFRDDAVRLVWLQRGTRYP